MAPKRGSPSGRQAWRKGIRLDLETFPTVALRAVPLDDDHPKVQQEDIASVKTVPAHFHLRVSSQSGLGRSEAPGRERPAWAGHSCAGGPYLSGADISFPLYV